MSTGIRVGEFSVARAWAFITLFLSLIVAFDLYAFWVITNNTHSVTIQIVYLAGAALFISGFLLKMVLQLHLRPLIWARENNYAFCVVETGAIRFCSTPEPVDLTQFKQGSVRRRRPPGKAYTVRELVFESRSGDGERIIDLADLRGDADRFSRALSEAIARER